MKAIFYILMLFPLAATAQMPDSTGAQHKPAAHRKPEGFAEIGYASEQWILSAHLPNGYSGVTYGGKGVFLGGGFKSRTDDKHPVGFDLDLNYISYTMDKSLKTNERVQTSYSFARLSPGVVLAFKTKSAVSFQAIGSVSILVPLQSKENSYYQFGIRGIIGYRAYGLIMGYNFSNSNNTPNSELATGKWSEHSVSLGALCYPARLIKKKIN